MEGSKIKYLDYYLYFLFFTEIIVNLGVWSGFNYFRGIVIIFYVMWLFFETLKPVKNSAIIILLVFILYSFILVMFSRNFYESFYNYNKVFTSLLFFPIAANYLSYEKILRIFEVFGNITIIYAAYLLIAISLGIGEGTYIDDVYTRGGVNSNTLTYFAIISPGLLMVNMFKGTKKVVFILSTLVCVIFILLSMKRTIMIMLLISLFIYLISIDRKLRFQYIRFFVIGIIILYATHNYWLNIFAARYEHREHLMRIETEVLQGELRTVELEAVLKEVFQFDNLSYSFFGRSAYYTPGEYGINVGYFFGPNRMIHNDVALLFNSTGIFGFLLYFSFLLVVIKRYILFKNYKKFIYRGNVFFTLYTIILVASLINMYNGSFYGTANRTLVFIFLGLMFTRPIFESQEKTSQQSSSN